MKRISIIGLAFVSVLSWAAEIVVTPSAREGSGEFASIQAALHVANAGDVVTVRAGVYRENLNLAKAYEGAPLTVRAAAGERVVVSGFVPIEGWKAVGGGVYSASVEAEVRELYVGLQEQQCGRWPEDGTRRAVLQADGEAKVFRTEPATDVPYLAELEKDPKGAIVFYYHARANAFGTGKLGHYDRGTGEIGFAEGSWNRWLGAEGNQFALMNHPALVRKPGDWAFVSEGASGGTVYFYPKAEADLRATRHRPVERPLLSIGHWKDRVGNVIVDGLEFMGSGAEAVKISADRKSVV